MKLQLSRIAEFIAPASDAPTGPAATGQYDGYAMAQGYSIDSRTVQPGEVFFAVKGERLDGHDFVEQALSRGAIAAVVRKDQLARYSNSADLLAVDDTLVALQTLATAVRKMWGKTVIGITGSMGKTTTKEAMAHLLAIKYRVHRTKGNFNNHFGLPLGLLSLEPEYDLAVVEMGMSHSGEISALARIAAPDQAVVTNVAPVHLESFDSIAGIARAKYELIEALPKTSRFLDRMARASILSARKCANRCRVRCLASTTCTTCWLRLRLRLSTASHRRRSPQLCHLFGPPTSADRSSKWVTSRCCTIATIQARRRLWLPLILWLPWPHDAGLLLPVRCWNSARPASNCIASAGVTLQEFRPEVN